MSARCHIFLLTILSIIIVVTALAKPPIYIQAKVYYNDSDELTQLQLMYLDIVETKENYIGIVATQDDLDKILIGGFEAEVIQQDLTSFYQSRLEPDRDMGGYKTLSEIEEYVDQMIVDHPNIVSSKIDIGLTLEGRTMWAVKISDNPEIDEEEAELLFTAAIHAREVITPEILLATMDFLTDGYGIDGRATYLVNNRELWFIPVINMDGYYYNEVLEPDGGGMWRKNRRDNGDATYGVDLNRNFGYQWGYDNVGSSWVTSVENYRGTGPFSEPETQNIRDFTIAHEFIITIHIHSCSEAIGWAYGYNSTGNPDESLFNEICDLMDDYNGYVCSHLYSINGCHEDWGYGEQTTKNKNLSFIVEAGNYIESNDCFWPPMEEIPQLLSENVPICLIAASVADRLEMDFTGFPGIGEIAIDNPVESAEYTVSWDLTEDVDNPLAKYELLEYMCNVGVLDEGGHLNGYDHNIFVSNDVNYHSAPESYYSQSWSNSIHYMQTYHPYEVQADDILEFWTYYDIQDRYDYAYVEVSADGTNFTPIEGNITTNYNPNGLNRGNGITGASGDWIQGLFDLSDFVGQNIYIRFSFYTDNSISKDGIYIDDIFPISFLDNGTIISSTNYATSHTFTEHPEGFYYYKMRAQDVDGQWGEYSDMAGTFVQPAFICGDADGDEKVNILDIVFLINYKYKDGPTPEILEACDVDSDTKINILDIVYLINFKYKGGPDPDCP